MASKFLSPLFTPFVIHFIISLNVVRTHEHDTMLLLRVGYIIRHEVLC